MNLEQPLSRCRWPKNEIMKSMMERVREIHERGIVHGDIKMDNMLLCGDGKIRLCDFRGAFFKDYAAEMRPIHTMWYAAPYRAVHWNGPLDIEDDYFALGVSIWELFTGRRLFEEMTTPCGSGSVKGMWWTWMR